MYQSHLENDCDCVPGKHAKGQLVKMCIHLCLTLYIWNFVFLSQDKPYGLRKQCSSAPVLGNGRASLDNP